ncbi:MAG: ATPase, partial [Lachnospiraceae bacterium]|nr:ATPase [Lachnospiraceae bacterium]
NSRIEQIIEEIEDYIDTCKGPLLGSGDKIVVNRERMEELLRELRMKTPEEIKRYQKILANKDAILADAQQKAEAIVAQANIQNQELVNEHEIMQQAYAQANQVIEMATAQAQEILDNATCDANEIRLGAIQYTDDMLANLQTMVSNVVETSNTRYTAMMNNFQDFYNVITSNRAELAPQTAEAEGTEGTEESAE